MTWTLKYNRYHWLEILGLEQHYARAEVRARLHYNVIELDEPTNISRFAIRTPQLAKVPTEVRIENQKLVLPDSITTKSPGVVLARDGGRWRVAGRLGEVRLTGTQPGLQGPIDDAFTAPSLCVRGSGQPWHSAAGAYADAALNRFAAEWHHCFRGELPIKADTEVTQEDVRTRNLILFGDPGSNPWIAKAFPQLPLSWTQETLRLKGREYASGNHIPALIAPNALPGGEGHYLVLNSGHSFREAELAKLNYLLFPRWGDWAIVEIDPRRDRSALWKEEITSAGYFDEKWQQACPQKKICSMPSARVGVMVLGRLPVRYDFRSANCCSTVVVSDGSVAVAAVSSPKKEASSHVSCLPTHKRDQPNSQTLVSAVDGCECRSPGPAPRGRSTRKAHSGL